MDLSIFKSYDIRGIYPTDLNRETAYEIGRAFIEYTKAKKVVVARDMRLSSPVLFRWLAKGIMDSGASVYSIGLVPTECLYFALGQGKYDAGIMITASHNPKEYNGFKMFKKKRDSIEAISGRNLVEFIKKGGLSKQRQSRSRAKIKKVNIWPGYLKHIFSFVETKNIKPFRVVADAGNGMAGKVMPLLVKKLPIKLIPLNFNLDGNFPAHPSNPLAKGAADQASWAIKKNKASFGFIFDGDSDRIFLIDEQGNLVRGDITILLLAKYLLKKNPGKAIVYNLICSRAVPQFIAKWGGKPIRSKVGFVNISEKMIENNGLMGGEVSGHFSFRDNFYHDSAFISFLILLEIISVSKKPVSALVKELSPYAKEPEINFKTADKKSVLKKIGEHFSDGKQDHLDGITVEYDNWWFNVRPSNTEPLLRLTIEAESKALLREKKKELVSFIGSC